MQGVILLGAVLLAALVTGSVGQDLVVAGTDVCVPACEVPSTRVGYAPPTTIVLSGSSVQWTSEDGEYHSATSANYCFDTRFDPGEVGTVSFEVRDGALYASSDGGPERRCGEATALPGGAFVVTYRCIFHPSFQQGAIVVLPDVGAAP